ncbi:hypothetical protein ABZY68_35620 [Streptomyces sp. NPDC006482]|uniref:hypothetical protein n=1 Tax=Streptomyces sp. NPDC006482 TaxID=3154306 RepID=UPI0033AAA287
MVRRRVPPATLALVAVGLVAGGLWWWAVLRLLLVPGEAGPVEGAVVAGGWGLSLLPVHVAASARRSGGGGRARVSGAGGAGFGGPGDGSGLGGAGGGSGVGGSGGGSGVTKASRRRRWGGGSGPS